MLGTLLALALTRYRFFGRNAISLLVDPADRAARASSPASRCSRSIQNVLNPVFGINAGLFTIIVGHATFCIVVVFNNVTARLRRLGGSLEAASADLGARPFDDLPAGDLPAAAVRRSSRAPCSPSPSASTRSW